MNVILIVLGIVIFLVAIGFIVYRKSSEEKVETKLKAAIAFSLVLILIGSSITVVPTGYTGVRTTFGQIDQRTVHAGINFKVPFVQSISKVNNKQQDITFKDKIWAVTGENTNVYFEDVTISYRINPEKSAWIFANVSDYQDTLLSNSLVMSALKAASVQLSADKITNRTLIEPLSKEQMQIALNNKFGVDTVFVISVNIGNVDFEQQYNEALEKKQLAQKELETAQIKNKTNIEKAEAEAKVKLLETQAAADAKLIQAKSEAEAKVIAADAEKKANEMLSQSLTPELLKKLEMEARMRWGWVTVNGGTAIVDQRNDSGQ